MAAGALVGSILGQTVQSWKVGQTDGWTLYQVNFLPALYAVDNDLSILLKYLKMPGHHKPLVLSFVKNYAADSLSLIERGEVMAYKSDSE